MKEALLYEKLSDERVRCALCSHRCLIAPGQKGICLVRENQGGSLYTLCLLYTSDAADDLLCVDLGGRRNIQKKKTQHTNQYLDTNNAPCIS